jgi:hypothetical protein
MQKITVGALALLPLSVFAAVPADVTTAMADMKTDALVVATAFLVAIIAISAFKLMRSAK